MRDELTDVTASIDGLRVSSLDPHTDPRPNALAGTIQELVTICEASIQHAKQAKSSLEDAVSPKPLDVAEFCALRRTCKDLASAAEKLAEASESCIVSFVKSFGSESQSQKELLSHFDEQIRSITHNTLDGTTEDNQVLWKIVEECYNQSNSTSGLLHFDHYYVTLGEAALGFPFDSDSESEKYCDHINRLHDEAHRQRYERMMKSRRKSKQDWISLWASKLQQCPGGPTLFYPPSAPALKLSQEDVAPYLFRTADFESSGRSDDRVVASMMSQGDHPENSKVDILQLPKAEGARILASHLRKYRFSGEKSDNLMSWCSSLLFVVQYAIWRCGKRGRSPKDVKIFAVETDKFPSGQFFRDMSLIRAYRHAAQSPDDAQFFRFRLRDARYNNGEYLSQGIVNHAGRSCVLSLDMLIETGLYSLFPELSEATSLWTNRVLELRNAWSTERATSQREVQLALQIARKCFPRLDISEMAAILLSFKNRKCKENINLHEIQDNNNVYGPHEVQRYLRLIELMKSLDKEAWSSLPRLQLLESAKLLENVLELSEQHAWRRSV